MTAAAPAVSGGSGLEAGLLERRAGGGRGECPARVPEPRPDAVWTPELWTLTRPGPLDERAARWVVRVASRAPSIHNTQPWRFVWDAAGIDVHADLSRRLDVVDPLGRQLLMSCGAAVLQARLALAALGRPARVSLLPDPSEPDLVARIDAGPVTEALPSLEDWALLSAVPQRRTVRGAFHADALSAPLRADLTAAARHEGACLTFVDDPSGRARVAELVETADRQQEAQARFREELAAWIRRDGAVDGIPPWASGHGWLETPGEFRLRNFDVAQPAARPSARATGRWDAPAVAVLATRVDAPRAWLNAGQALARVLLTATCAGVRASMLNQPIEVDGTRELLASRGCPQAVLRLGYADLSRPTGRRPLDDVLSRRA